MLIGTAGLVWVKLKSDPAPAAKAFLGADYALITLLFLSAATGLLLLVLRDTSAMGNFAGIASGSNSGNFPDAAVQQIRSRNL